MSAPHNAAVVKAAVKVVLEPLLHLRCGLPSAWNHQLVSLPF